MTIVRGVDSDAELALAIGPLQLTLRRKKDGESADESADDVDARRRLEVVHLPLVVDVLANIHQDMFIQFRYLSTVVQALPFFLRLQSPMYTSILVLVHRATPVPKGRPSRSSTLMAPLHNTFQRNPPMCKTEVLAVVHLMHLLLLRSLVRSIYRFFLLVMNFHHETLVSFHEKCTACIWLTSYFSLSTPSVWAHI